MSLTYTSNPLYGRLTCRDYRFHPALINGIRRFVANYVPGYMFPLYLDQADYTFLTDVVGIQHLVPGHPRYSVLTSTSRYSIPHLSVHGNQVAAYDPPDAGGSVLAVNDRRIVYFAICNLNRDDPVVGLAQPYINTEAAPKQMYVHDLQPFVFLRQDDIWTYAAAESDRVRTLLPQIFSYNSLLALVEYGCKLHALWKPTLMRGKQHPSAIPCRARFAWMANPTITAIVPLVNPDFTLRRKVEYEPSARDVFLADRVDSTEGRITVNYQNKFERPYGLDLILEYNGTLTPKAAFLAALSQYKTTLGYFREELVKPDSQLVSLRNPVNASKTAAAATEAAAAATEYSQHAVRREWVIPLNPELDLNTYEQGQYAALGDDAVGEIIALKLLELVDTMIGASQDLWAGACIYFRIPHRLVNQAILHVELSTEILERYQGDPGDPVTQMLLAAIAAAEQDLTEIEHVIQADGEPEHEPEPEPEHEIDQPAN
jgi:hypothetical protein